VKKGCFIQADLRRSNTRHGGSGGGGLDTAPDVADETCAVRRWSCLATLALPEAEETKCFLPKISSND